MLKTKIIILIITLIAFSFFGSKYLSFAQKAPITKEIQGKKPGSTKTVKTKKVSSKVDNFLVLITKSNSLDNIAKEFKKANFTDKEKRRIQEELQKQRYASKLKKLQKKRPVSGRSKDSIKADNQVVKKMKAFITKQDMEVKRLNLESRNSFNRIKHSNAAMNIVRPEINKVAPKRTTPLNTDVLHPGMLGFGTIDTINPHFAIPGQNITIRGSDFGDNSGTLKLVIGEGTAYFSEISQWNDNFILAPIPLTYRSGGAMHVDIKFLIGETPKQGRIFVIPRGKDIGPSKTIEIRPDGSTMIPEITRVSSLEISPGQAIFVEGNNFLREAQGYVDIKFRTYDGSEASYGCEILNWNDRSVSFRLGEMSRGFLAQTAEIRLRNHVRYDFRATAQILLKPRMEIRYWKVNHSIDCSWKIYGKKRTRTDNDFYCINGWEVFDYALDVHGGGISWGAVYDIRPRAGQQSCRSRVEYWADLFSSVDCDNYLYIKGPKGVPATEENPWPGSPLY